MDTTTACAPKKRRRTSTPIGATEPNPTGQCRCGCGQTTTRAAYLYRDGVRYHNAHRDFVHGHHERGRTHSHNAIGPASANLQLRIGPHGSGQPHVCLDCGSTRIAPTSIEEDDPCQ